MSASGISGQPFYAQSVDTGVDGLIVNGPVKTRSVTLELDADADDDLYVRGRLLHRDADGKYHAIGSTETTISIIAAGEVGADAVNGTATEFSFTLAHPPVPRSLRVVTTANGSATVVKDAGTDNGYGAGVGADGSFTVNYNTGQVVVTFTTAPTATHDVKVAYKWREVDAPDTGESQAALPIVILGEDIPATRINAADVVSFAYDAGEFSEQKLYGYSAGYQEIMRVGGIYVRP